MRETEARLPEEDCDKILLESSFAQDLPGRVRSWETWLPFPTQCAVWQVITSLLSDKTGNGSNPQNEHACIHVQGGGHKSIEYL